MHIRDPEDIERDRLAVEAEAEADDLMDDFSGAAPVDLARNLMVERDKVDMQPEITPLVAEVLRGRQSGPFDRAFDVAVSRLGGKLEGDGRHPQLIKTVRGGGYVFACDVERE